MNKYQKKKKKKLWNFEVSLEILYNINKTRMN